MSLRRRFAWGVLLSALVAFGAYYVEYLPFTGRWIASYRLSRYVQVQYPGFQRGKVIFDPCNGPYLMTAVGSSGETVKLGIGADGMVYDSTRAEDWHRETGGSENWDVLNADGVKQYGGIGCRWRYDIPERPAFLIRIQLRESEEAPFPETETALRERMAAIFEEYWAALSEAARESITDVELTYCHYASEREKQQPYDDIYHVLTIPVHHGVAAEEQIMTTKIKESRV